MKVVIRYTLPLLVVLCASALAHEWSCVRIVPSTSVSLRDPTSLAVSLESVLYIADYGHHRVVAVDSSGELIAETGGLGNAHGRFQWPRQVTTAANGVFVLDYGNRRIEKFSRSLEYQGTIMIPGSSADVSGQPEVMALAPHGDLYVFERDGGRLLHFDPLFRVLSDVKGDRFGRAVSSVALMTFVSPTGLAWWERGEHQIHFNDPMLNVSASRAVPWSGLVRSLASVDSCLAVVGDSVISVLCADHTRPDVVMGSRELGLAGSSVISGVAFESRDLFYVLEGRTGSVFRIARVRE